MEIGLSRGPSLSRAPAVSQQSVVDAVHKPGAGGSHDLAEGNRASAATHRPLDAKGPQAAGADPMPAHHDPRAKAHEERARALGEGREPTSTKDEEEVPGAKTGGAKLDEEDQRMVESLQRSDQAVRAHEAAHMAAAGGYAAGGPSYTTQQGPDGRSYAIGGEVPIDMSAERTPEATLRKAQTIRAAAMAPADPSAADKAIAGAASQMAQAAQAQMAEKAAEASEAALPPEAKAQPEAEAEAIPQVKPELQVLGRQGSRSIDGSADVRQSARPETQAGEVPEESDALQASSTEGFTQLKEALSESTGTDEKQVATNKRGQISKAYVTVAQTAPQASLKGAVFA